jgi:hypothetical protein
MIEAITTTNSGKPIGRWLDETQASALSVTLRTSQEQPAFIGHAAPHNPFSGMAGALLAGLGHSRIREKNFLNQLRSLPREESASTPPIQ